MDIFAFQRPFSKVNSVSFRWEFVTLKIRASRLEAHHLEVGSLKYYQTNVTHKSVQNCKADESNQMFESSSFCLLVLIKKLLAPKQYAALQEFNNP